MSVSQNLVSPRTAVCVDEMVIMKKNPNMQVLELEEDRVTKL